MKLQRYNCTLGFQDWGWDCSLSFRSCMMHVLSCSTKFLLSFMHATSDSRPHKSPPSCQFYHCSTLPSPCGLFLGGLASHFHSLHSRAHLGRAQKSCSRESGRSEALKTFKHSPSTVKDFLSLSHPTSRTAFNDSNIRILASSIAIVPSHLACPHAPGPGPRTGDASRRRNHQL